MSATESRSFITRYRYDENVSYENDDEYRQMLKMIFLLDEEEETDDHDGFNETTVVSTIEHIFQITKDEPVFQSLYLHCAATFFSENAQIGIFLLFSYDYFTEFHQCLQHYITTGTISPEDVCVISLKEKISAR